MRLSSAVASRSLVWPIVVCAVSGLFAALAMGAPDSLVLFESSLDGTVDGVDANGAVKPLAVEGKVAYAEGRAGGKALVCGGDGALVKYSVDGHFLAGQVSLNVDPKRLGLGAKWAVTDAFDESTAPVEDKAVKLAIPARNCKMVVVQ